MKSAQARLLIRTDSSSMTLPLVGDTVSIGRQADCTISLTSAGLADRHCIVQTTRGGHEVFDLFSDSGTFVNGQRVEAAPLAHGDQVRIGSLRLTYLADIEEDHPQPVRRVLDLEPAPQPEFDPQVFPLAGSKAAGSAPKSPPPEPTPKSAPRSRSRLRVHLAAWLPSFERNRTPSASEVAADWTPPAAEDRVHIAMSEAHRFRGRGFSEELIESLRQTPFYAMSVMVHAVIAILLSLLTTTAPTEPEEPPVIARIDTRDVYAEAAEEEESEEESLEPELAEIEEPEIEIVEAPTLDDSTFEESPDAALDDANPAIEGPFSGAGLAGLGEGLGGRGERGLRAVSGEGGGLKKRVLQLRSSGLDIVFVVDSTGSMGRVLNDARNEIGGLISNLSALVPNFRLGVVTFRDHAEEYLTREEPLEDNHYRQVAFLDTIEAGGGGKTPEAVYDGLKKAIRGMSWSPKARRIVVLVGDAEPHAEDDKEIARLCRNFSRRNGTVHTMVTPSEQDGFRTNISHRARRAFQEIAKSGRGSALELNQGDALTERILELAVGPDYAAELRLAIARLESSPETLRFRRLAKEGRLSLIHARLKRDPPDPLLMRELLRLHRPELWPVYRSILEDRKLKDRSRWAAAGLMRRMVRATADEAQAAAMCRRISPNERRDALHTSVDQIQTALGY